MEQLIAQNQALLREVQELKARGSTSSWSEVSSGNGPQTPKKKQVSQGVRMTPNGTQVPEGTPPETADDFENKSEKWTGGSAMLAPPPPPPPPIPDFPDFSMYVRRSTGVQEPLECGNGYHPRTVSQSPQYGLPLLKRSRKQLKGLMHGPLR